MRYDYGEKNNVTSNFMIYIHHEIQLVCAEQGDQRGDEGLEKQETHIKFKQESEENIPLQRLELL
jgi:hypothetical protein